MDTGSQLIRVIPAFVCAIGWTAAPAAQAGERGASAGTAAEAAVPAPLPPPGGAATRHGLPDSGQPAVRGAAPPGAAVALPSGTSPGPLQPATPATPAGPSRMPARPVMPAVTPADRAVRPTGPLLQTRPGTLQPGKPDYAISLDSQQEYNNTSMSWTFRIVNNGKAAPESSVTTAPGSTDWHAKLPVGSKASSTEAAKLVISVGKPCPKQTSWKPIESMPLPILEPGASVVVPQGRYKMPDTYAGKGCRFRARIDGPVGDVNTSNNDLQMITKTALMPDLVLELDTPQLFASGGVLVVRNAGSAPAAPSKAVYQCETNDPDIVCGHITDPWKPKALIEYKVPELKPGQRHELKGLTPKAGSSASWKATADVYYEIVESNEGNNTLSGPKK